MKGYPQGLVLTTELSVISWGNMAFHISVGEVRAIPALNWQFLSIQFILSKLLFPHGINLDKPDVWM